MSCEHANIGIYHDFDADEIRFACTECHVVGQVSWPDKAHEEAFHDALYQISDELMTSRKDLEELRAQFSKVGKKGPELDPKILAAGFEPYNRADFKRLSRGASGYCASRACGTAPVLYQRYASKPHPDGRRRLYAYSEQCALAWIEKSMEVMP